MVRAFFDKASGPALCQKAQPLVLPALRIFIMNFQIANGKDSLLAKNCLTRFYFKDKVQR